MSSTANITTTPAPPEHYPLKDWAWGPSSEWWVEPELRADYARVNVTPEMYSGSERRIVTTIEAQGRSGTAAGGGFSTTFQQPVPFDAWAHATRLRTVRSELRHRKVVEDYRRRYERICPSCGGPSSTLA